MKKKIKKLTRPHTSNMNTVVSQTPNSITITKPEILLNNANNYASS